MGLRLDHARAVERPRGEAHEATDARVARLACAGHLDRRVTARNRKLVDDRVLDVRSRWAVELA
eukprot:6056225-Prymnesium_polylepis.1